MKISKVVPIFAIVLIPLSWIVSILYSNYIMGMFANNNLSTEQMQSMVDVVVHIPLIEILTFATVVIPAIMVRKAVREGTGNLAKRSQSQNQSQTITNVVDVEVEED